MRIAQIVPSLRLAGPVNVAVDLARRLSELGHDVHLFYLDECVEQDVGLVPAQRVSAETVNDLAGFDIVHSHCLRPDLFVYRCRKRLQHVRKITTIHNIVHEDLGYSRNWLVAKLTTALWLMLWRKAFDSCVVLSDFSSRYYSEYLPEGKLRRVYNGRVLGAADAAAEVDPTVARQVAAWRESGKIVIGSCAMLTPVKGLEQVLSFLTQDERFAYLLIGDGPAQSELESLVRCLGITERVHFAGRKKNVLPYLQKMDLFALPSRSEGLPLAGLEAASAGVPILCSDIPIFREVFDERSAAFFTLDDVVGFGDAIRSMSGRLSEMGLAAQTRYRNLFTVEKMADNYLSLYAEIRLAA